MNRPEITNLLWDPDDGGYPSDYLLARISARRSQLLARWESLAQDADALDRVLTARYPAQRGSGGGAAERSAEGVWLALLKEYRWIYGQMNAHMRRHFQPFFLYTELKTIFICLRYLKDDKRRQIDYMLATSLLAGPLKGLLKKASGVPSAAAGLEQAFAALSDRFRGIAGVHKTGGLREFEPELTNRYLETALTLGLHPRLGHLFRMIIDARNSITAVRSIVRGTERAPSLLPGGLVRKEQFVALLAKKDGPGLGRLISRAAGIQVDADDPSGVETAFYRAITRNLRHGRWDDPQAGAILHYLWSRSMEAMNLSTLLYGRELERETVLAELVM